jgi:hypothetical protein
MLFLSYPRRTLALPALSAWRQTGQTDDRAIEQAQGREQGRRAVALVVVGHCATAAFLHREARLGTVQGLDLAFLIHAQDEGMPCLPAGRSGGSRDQAHDIFYCLLKVWIPACQQGQPVRGKAPAPQAHGLPTGPHGGGNGPVLVALLPVGRHGSGQQDHLGAQGQADRRAPSPRPLLSLCAFIIGHLPAACLAADRAGTAHGHHLLRER